MFKATEKKNALFLQFVHNLIGNRICGRHISGYERKFEYRDSDLRVAIIGGGAAGIFGAISAATHNSAAEIVVLEATRRPLAKVLISGGGRCNVTHRCFDSADLVKNYPRGNRELLGPFNKFQPRDTIAWFERHGVRLKAEEDGRMFPITDRSQTIADCLLETAAELGVELRLEAGARNIAALSRNKAKTSFEIEFQKGTPERFDRILIATGSARDGYRIAESLGHSIVPCVPSLFTFRVNDARLDGLAGISIGNVKLTLADGERKKIEQAGDLLITHWGLSGPAVLRLSSWGARILHENKYRGELLIDLLPGYNREQLHDKLHEFRNANHGKQIINANPFALPRKFWERLIQHIGILHGTLWGNMTGNHMTALIEELSCGRYEIAGKGEFKDEFVTSGGVNLREVDFRTMQSKVNPGLYFAGEILDIDGITGGFNFQNAWTTGWIAGMNMVL